MSYQVKGLSSLRAERFMTQKELATKAKVSSVTVSHAERGGAISLATLKGLADALGVTVEKLAKRSV
jgi:transcriptional regulator with XRE-family HTH domain